MVKQWWSRQKCAAPSKMRPPAVTQWKSTSPLLRHLQQWRSQSLRSLSLHFWQADTTSPIKFPPTFPLSFSYFPHYFLRKMVGKILIFSFIFFFHHIFHVTQTKKIIFHMIFFPFLSIFRKPNIVLCYDGRKIGLPIYHGFKVISQ